MTPPKTITFVRHGQSTANAGGLTMAHDAIPLSELGQLHAQFLATALPDRPSLILTSEYLRAQHTAQPYCERVGVPQQTHPLLHEFSTIDPALLEGMYGEQRRPFVEAYWQEPHPDKRMGEGAETFAEFDERVSAFVPQLQQLPQGAVVFGHGMWIGLLVFKLLGFTSRDIAGMKAFRRFQLGLPMPNGAVYRFHETSSGHWYTQADEPIMRSLLALRLNPAAVV
jgi:broad specificity phosphatase PhoE